MLNGIADITGWTTIEVSSDSIKTDVLIQDGQSRHIKRELIGFAINQLWYACDGDCIRRPTFTVTVYDEEGAVLYQSKEGIQVNDKERWHKLDRDLRALAYHKG